MGAEEEDLGFFRGSFLRKLKRQRQNDFSQAKHNEQHAGKGAGVPAQPANSETTAQTDAQPEGEDAEDPYHQRGEQGRQPQQAGPHAVGEIVQHEGQAQQEAFP